MIHGREHEISRNDTDVTQWLSWLHSDCSEIFQTCTARTEQWVDFTSGTGTHCDSSKRTRCMDPIPPRCEDAALHCRFDASASVLAPVVSGTAPSRIRHRRCLQWFLLQTFRRHRKLTLEPVSDAGRCCLPMLRRDSITTRTSMLPTVTRETHQERI